MSRIISDGKGGLTQTPYDIRDYITAKNTSVWQLCEFLAEKTGSALYDQWLDRWLNLPLPVAQWCWNQIMDSSVEGQVVHSRESMAYNLMRSVDRATEILALLSSAES